ncbi:MAG: RnfABCDGE type electron transport complex subunit B [Candidatus Marinimicrobia bacterium]|nr:RnfABCDGE type electron transport complex subunit B [Candidatus Neomarinimicrobiota bacterium]
MDINAIVISMASMGGLGLLFSAGLAIANKKLYVEEDARIAEVMEELPGANCGGCGYPGCANFAENVVNGKALIGGCPVNTDDGAEAIARIMGVDAETGERLIARVICRGGDYETAKKGIYDGIQSCTAAHLMGGGDRLCEYGCIGYGECVEVCPFDAMYMNDNNLPVVIDDKCTGCGNCAEICPRAVIEMHPESHKLFILCNNHDTPKVSRQVCIRACVGCGLCVRAVEEGEIIMDDNLAKINYDTYGRVPVIPTEKCSTNAFETFGAEETSEVAA